MGRGDGGSRQINGSVGRRERAGDVRGKSSEWMTQAGGRDEELGRLGFDKQQCFEKEMQVVGVRPRHKRCPAKKCLHISFIV